MEFQLPQFIEREPKIVGFFTFKQFIFVGIAGAACFVIYFLVPLSIFIISCIVLGGGSLALAFVKIEGRPLPIFIKNFFIYNVSSKIFLWQRKEIPPKVLIRKEEPKKKEVEEEAVLKVIGKSRLNKLSTQIETKTK